MNSRQKTHHQETMEVTKQTDKLKLAQTKSARIRTLFKKVF